MESLEQKTARNCRVQARYDELMREGKRGHYETMFRVVREEVESERERWQDVAKAVISSHDAALAYVYEKLRSQGLSSIMIPDAAVSEIKAVNELRSLVFGHTTPATPTADPAK